ncbi:long-chain fatty acid--CoA ligase [Pelagibacteraceae bacterium]|nr:long-chain fatty acid--CoA ligase [Pelagibacteraceae bacterium]
MNISSYKSLPELFLEKSEENSHKIQLVRKNKETGNDFIYSWAKTKKEVFAFANFLSQQNIKKGDRVMLVSENRPEWLISDIAIMCHGLVTVPNYTTYSVKDFEYIIKDCKPAGLVVSSKALLKKIIQAKNNLNYGFNFIIHLDPFEIDLSGEKLISYSSVVQTFSEENSFSFDRNILSRKDPACIIYTSGTEGNPKGVVLSHGGILSNCEGAVELLSDIKIKNHVFLTWLPLSHSYEHTIQFVQIALNAKVFYAESLEKLLINLKESTPTIMTAVPRFYNNFYNKILIKLNKESYLKKIIFNKTIEIGTKIILKQKISFMEKILNFVLTILVRKKIQQSLGGNIQTFVSGGGPLDPKIGLFLNALGLKTMQGYGLTETSPVVSCNPINSIKVETVGKVLKNCKVKIAEDGEILVKGENVMLGYWNNEEATKKAIIDEWLYTGDIGEIDSDGYLKITDRKKDIIVTLGGDNISPAKIENLLCNHPEIDQAFVYGDNKNYLISLIVANKELNPTKEKIQEVIDKTNENLTAIEKIKNFSILEESFSAENNMLTPTLKMKRYIIKKNFEKLLNSFYKKK